MINNAMSRRGFGGLALGLAAAGSAAGCVQVPEPISATPPPRPAVDVADVPGILKHYEEAYAKAAKSYDLKAMASIEADPILRATKDHFGMRKKFTSAPDTVSTLIDPDVFPLAAEEYPRSFMTVASTSKPREGWERSVELRERSEAVDSWRLRYSVHCSSGESPAIERDDDGLARSVDSTVKEFGRAPEDLPALIAEAMENPGSAAAKEIAGSRAWKDATGQVRKEREDMVAVGNATVVARPQAQVFAVRGQDSVLSFVTVDFTASTQARRNQYITFDKDHEQGRYYSGEYQSVWLREQYQLLVRQSADAKLQVVGRNWFWTGLDAS